MRVKGKAARPLEQLFVDAKGRMSAFVSQAGVSFEKSVQALDAFVQKAAQALTAAPRPADPLGDRLLASTADFRTRVAELRTLAASSSPQAREQLAVMEAELSTRYGYRLDAVPEPESLWVDPQFMGGELPGGRLDAQALRRREVKAVVARSPDEVLFSRGRALTLLDDEGRPVLARSADEYRALVAQNRQALGIGDAGELVGVHMCFEGGGGKGKRYGAALQELYALGVVPVGLTGTSAGSIAASFAAAGADPAQLDALVKSPAVARFFDPAPLRNDGAMGLLNGNAAYAFFDQKLRELTGIKDRPVTFADLEVPLELLAVRMFDTKPEASGRPESRVFVFSQKTTPDTPVALAMRASMALPGVFDPVQMVDPVSGRKVYLVDGAVLDNLPMGYQAPSNLPVVGLSLGERGSNHPSLKYAHDGAATLPALNRATWGWTFRELIHVRRENDGGPEDFVERNRPRPGQFMLSLPVWDLENPSRANHKLDFAHDPKVDGPLDVQTRRVVRRFLAAQLPRLTEAGAFASNTTDRLPERVAFDVRVQLGKTPARVVYEGGDAVVVKREGKPDRRVRLGQERIEAMFLDDLAFGDLSAQLAHELLRRPFRRPSAPAA